MADTVRRMAKRKLGYAVKDVDRALQHLVDLEATYKENNPEWADGFQKCAEIGLMWGSMIEALNKRL